MISVVHVHVHVRLPVHVHCMCVLLHTLLQSTSNMSPLQSTSNMSPLQSTSNMDIMDVIKQAYESFGFITNDAIEKMRNVARLAVGQV